MTMVFRKLLIAFGILIAFSTFGFAQKVTERTTPAGHAYWHYPVDDAKRTAISIFWPSGLSELPVGQEVAARVGINLMLNGGAGGKAPEEIIADFEDLDAGAQLFVQPDGIRGFIVTPDESANDAALIANDVLRAPNLDEKWFERERERYVGEGKASDSNVWGVTWNLARRAMLDGHPNERFWSMQPTDNTVAVSLKTIGKWHKRAFGTDGFSITVAGTSSFEGIEKAIDKALEGLPSDAPPKVLPLETMIIPAKTVVFHAPWADKSTVLILGELPNLKTEKTLEVNLATGVLGYGQQSRLFKAIRSELRVAYGFQAGMEEFTREHRILNLGGEVETEKLQQALDAAKVAYEEFRTVGVGIIEFPFARRYYGQRIEEEIKKPESVAYMLMEAKLNSWPKNSVETMIERIGNLDRSSVNEFIAKAYPPFDDMLKIVVTPKADAIAGACVITSYDELSTC